MYARSIIAAALVCFVMTSATQLCLAQLPNLPATLVATHQGSAVGDQTGTALAGIGDVNSDGVGDYLVGSPFDDTLGSNFGKVTIYSGATHTPFTTIFGAAQDARLGLDACGLNHLDGTPTNQFVVVSQVAVSGSSTTGVLSVRSGSTGAVLFSITGGGAQPIFGTKVSGGGDINNDGTPDFLVGATTAGGLEQVIAFSGLNGSVIHTITAPTPLVQFGFSFDIAGDANGDGFDDIVVGSPLDAFGGTASIYSGFDGSLLQYIVTQQSLALFGNSVSYAGDVNKDGFDDVLVGAPFGDITGARVHSGFDGSLLRVIDGINQFDGYGAFVDHAGDVDGDGYEDHLIGRAEPNSIFGTATGSLHIVSGRDGKELCATYTSTFEDAYGAGATSIGDISGDLVPDFIVAANLDDGAGIDTGAAYVFVTPTFPTRRYDSPTNGGTTLDLSWTPEGGNAFTGNPYSLTGTITCTNGSPGGSGLFGVSLTPIDFPMSFGFPLLIANDPINLISTGQFGYDAAGELTAMGVSRQNPFLAGSNLYLQFFEFAPMIAGSNGLRMLVSP